MTRRLSSHERRRQIVEATLELLADTSVESITTRQVAKRVGVTQPALFRHFRSRDQILAAVVEHTRGELEALALAALEHQSEPLVALDSLLQALFDHMANHPGLPRLLFFSAAADRSARYAAPIQRLVSAQRALVAELVSQAQRAGSISAEVNPRRAGFVMVALIQGTVLQQTPTPADARQTAAELMAFWLSGMVGGLHRPTSPAPAAVVVESKLAAISTLDVRPILDTGDDPLDTILETLRRVPEDGVLILTAPFEPRPLLKLLAAKGYRTQCELVASKTWRVEILPSSAPVPMDLRDLEAPGPAERVLQTVATFESGSCLIARVPRVPRLLLPQLDQRGLRWQVQDEGHGAILHVRMP